MLLRPGPLITLLSKNVARQHLKVSSDQAFISGSFCMRRGLTAFAHSKSSYGNGGEHVGQTRSITWSQLLANTEKTKPESNKKPGAKELDPTKSESISSDIKNDSKDNDYTDKASMEIQLESKDSLSKHTSPETTKASDSVDEVSTKKTGLEKLKDTINKAVKPKRLRVELSETTLERNFITPIRAMSDFLLKPGDLEGLRKTKRRSPFESEPPITVYWRKDVESRANQVWGSKENLLNELGKRDMENKRYQQNVFSVKRQLRDYMRMQGREMTRAEKLAQEAGLFGSSGRVVLTAVAINGSNFLFKMMAWLYTGSHSMFAECVHSLADTINQLILAYGIYKSTQQADSDHPYGYSNMRYVASLISGVGIFCVGTGLSFYHGVTGLINPTPLDDFYWAFFVLCGSLLSEGATLMMAVNAIKKGASLHNMTFKDYIMRGQDPSVNVVLLEDMAAVCGVVVCLSCMGLTSYYGSHIPDAVGSLLVGCILGSVASFIIYTNVAGLVGRSIPHDRLEKINNELEGDVMVRAIYDVKGIDMGNFLVRYKAEVDFDGRELTRAYLDKQDLQLMLEEVKSFKDIDELESFMVKHGENIVDMMGGEIDRIEVKLRKKYPEIRHCDLEIL